MTEPRDRHGNEFDSPKWRSPLTHSTKAEIMVKRATFRENVQRVNADIIDLYAERERIRLELEERDNG